MQPIHNAHIWLMKQALKENNKLLIVLGSANKVDMLRNPFSFELRTDLLDSVIFEDEELRNRSNDINVINLPDWSMESKTEDSKIWGDYLYYNIVSQIGQKSFSIYFSDEPSIIKSWFSDNLLNNYITLRLFDRSNLFEGLSATKIRQAFSDSDYEYIKKYCSSPIYQRFVELRIIWCDVVCDPVDDFEMK